MVRLNIWTGCRLQLGLCLMANCGLPGLHGLQVAPPLVPRATLAASGDGQTSSDLDSSHPGWNHLQRTWQQFHSRMFTSCPCIASSMCSWALAVIDGNYNSPHKSQTRPKDWTRSVYNIVDFIPLRWLWNLRESVEQACAVFDGYTCKLTVIEAVYMKDIYLE